jgi:arylsulfatase A-like enzyme
MIRLPGGRGGGTRIATPVSLLDVMPTVLELLGVDEITLDGLSLQGTSLAESVRSGREPAPRHITSELRWDRPGNPSHDWLVAHHYQDQKLIYDEIRGVRVDGEVVQRRELFDLAADPNEQHDLSAAGGQTLDRLLEIHRLWRRAIDLRNPDAEMQPGELDCAELRQLVELGYMDGAAAEEALAKCEEESGG